VVAYIRKVVNETAGQLPKGSSVDQTQTMEASFSGLLFGLLGAVVLIDLLIVVNFQSWSDPFVTITALPRRAPASSGSCSPPRPRFRCRR
jgi:multidrug efflux pump subunit AcrB